MGGVRRPPLFQAYRSAKEDPDPNSRKPPLRASLTCWSQIAVLLVQQSASAAAVKIPTRKMLIRRRRYSAVFGVAVLLLLSLFQGMTVTAFSPVAVASTEEESELVSGDPAADSANSTTFQQDDIIVEDPTLVDAFALVFQKFEPSVVGLITLSSIGGNKRAMGRASGVIISEDGLILTCQHNIQDLRKSDKIYAVLSDRRMYRAKILGQDDVMDAAVLQLLLNERTDDMFGKIFHLVTALSDQDTPEQIDWDAPLSVAEIGNSTEIPIGSQVLALGFDTARGIEVQAGIVNSFHENDGGFQHILTDAGMYKGYSGGPLVDVATGKVIGIHSHSITTIRVRTEKSEVPESGEERNYALAIDAVKDSLPQMIAGETMAHATIGDIIFLGLTQDLPQGSLTSGAEIVSMESKCRGRKAGLRENDVIVEIGGQEVKTARDAEKLIDQAPIGEKIEIVVMRNGENRKTVKVKPSSKPGNIRNEEVSKIPLLRLINWIRSLFN